MKGQLILTLDTIQHLDMGKAALTFDDCLHRGVRDCIERPGDKRPRKVEMQLTLTPLTEIHGKSISCEGAKGVFVIRVTVPNYQTGEVDFGVRNTGALIFSPENPHDHRQTSLIEEDSSEE